MENKKLTVEYVYRELKPKCIECKHRLGRKSILDWGELCGLDDFIDGDGALCIKCGNKATRSVQKALSFAIFGEEDRYNDVDFNDFPGFRD